MKLPILAYGHAMLREECKEIDNSYPELNKLIDNMWETAARRQRLRPRGAAGKPAHPARPGR